MNLNSLHTCFLWLCLGLLLHLPGLAQSPQLINYQAIARNQQGNVFANTTLTLRFSIQNSTGSIVAYQETHQVSTNQFGLFTAKIGGGNPSTGSFSTIDWSQGNLHLKADIDVQNNGQFVTIGSEQLLSVPYALFAQQAANAGSGTPGPQGPVGPQGPAGQNGNTIYNGSTNPDASLGTNGDFYINTTTNTLFGPKTASGWGAGVSLVGPAGTGGGNGWSLTGNNNTTPGTGTNQNYLGTSDARNVILATNQTERILIGADGKIRFTGDFANQELTGSIVTVGNTSASDPASTVLGGVGSASAATLWLENNAAYCAVCTQPYAQTLPNFAGQAEIIDYPVQSITVEDGAGVNNSGVLFMANVTIKSTNNASSLGNSNRFSLWVQRSTDPTFQTNVTNVYRVEDGLSGGITNTINPPTLGSGIACTSIIYPDLNLQPGTYYYRLVYQNIMGSNNGQTLFAQDRSIVLMQIKR